MTGIGPLLRLYAGRLRTHPVRNLLSVLGVAAGVALIFAIQVVNDGLSANNERLEREIAGRADDQLIARAPTGMDQSIYRRIRALPQVEAAAPVTQHHIVLAKDGKVAELTLFGVDERLRELGGSLALAGFARSATEASVGLYLPPAIAERLEVRPGDSIQIRSRGERNTTAVAGILTGEGLGALSRSRVAIAPLGLAQRLTASPGRIARLVVALRGTATPAAVGALRAVSGPGVDILPIGAESKLLSQASAIDRQAASLFAAVSLAVGLLLAYNAMLLSVMERRREIAVMRMIGAPPGTLVGALLLETAAIGVVGTLLGLGVGWGILVGVVERSPTYLETAFPLSAQPAATPLAFLTATAAGIGGTLAAAAYPMLMLMRVSPAAALRAEGLPGGESRLRGVRWSITVLGVVLMAAGVAIEQVSPGLGIFGIVMFVGGGGLLLPDVVPPLTRLAKRKLERVGAVVQMGAAELAALPARATATAGVGAVTAIVLVMIGSSVENLSTGTKAIANDAFGERTVWVSVAGQDNVYYTRPFSHRYLAKVRRVEGIQGAKVYRAAFLDWGGRRLFTFAVTPTADNPLGPTEVFEGSGAHLMRELRKRGTAALTWTLARDRGIDVGDTFEVPTPTGDRRVRLAGRITNYGWQSGALYLNASDFAEYWGSSDITAVEALLEPGAQAKTVKRRVEAALGPAAALRVETNREAEARVSAVASEGVGQLRRVSLIAGLAAVLAVTAAMLTAVSQRQRRLAALRAIGMSARQVYLALVAEALIVLLIGAGVGMVIALPAQALTVDWISQTTGYPIKFRPELGPMLAALGVTLLIGLVAGSLPARRTTHAPIAPNLAYE